MIGVVIAEDENFKLKVGPLGGLTAVRKFDGRSRRVSNEERAYMFEVLNILQSKGFNVTFKNPSDEKFVDVAMWFVEPFFMGPSSHLWQGVFSQDPE